MPSVKKYDIHGNSDGEMELSEVVFNSPINESVIHQSVVAHLANLRVGTADTKDRGDVRGGGRKPWRQKHTGRARSGSNRSPVWVGGGVAHGPHPRDYHKKINKKMRRLAIRGALTKKVKEGVFFVLAGADIEKPSTKSAISFLDKIDVKGKMVLVTGADHLCFSRSLANIPGARAIRVESINVYDIINNDSLIMTADAVHAVEEVFSK